MNNYIITSHWTDGDILPFLRIGKKLKEAGNRVVIMTHIYYKDMVIKNGMEFIAWDSWEEYNNMLQYLKEEIEKSERLSGSEDETDEYNCKFKNVERRYEEYTKICDCIKLCSNNTCLIAKSRSSVSAMLAAEKMKIPLISVMLTPYEMEYTVHLYRNYKKHLISKTNELRNLVGLDEIKDWLEWQQNTGQLIVTWPEWFGKQHVKWRTPNLYAGFLQSEVNDVLYNNIDDEARKMLEDTKQPPILITGGTSTMLYKDFYNSSVKACGVLGYPTILVTRYEEQVPKEMPDNVKWCTYLPLDKILGQCRMILHHGGMGTAIGALKAGIPQIINAYLLDRPYTADQMEHMGVACSIKKDDWNTDELVQVIKTIESKINRKQCTYYSELIEKDNALDNICDFLKKK